MTTLRLDSVQEQPRERLIQHGPVVLTTAELLAIIIGSGSKNMPVVQFCSHLLKQFGSLRSLLSASSEELLQIKGMGQAKTCQILALQEIASRALEEQLRSANILNQSQVVKKYCCNQLGKNKIEFCQALLLDKGYRLIHSEIVAKGTIDQASIYPREIVKLSLKHHAAHIILAHNHPSGSLTPSPADLQLTDHLKKALDLVDIKLIDHLIVSHNKAVSLAELGHL